MNYTYAYLILVLDIGASPPTVLGASIFGEAQPTLGPGRRCFTIHDERGATYDEADAFLRNAIASHPFFAWVRPIFRERDGSNPFTSAGNPAGPPLADASASCTRGRGPFPGNHFAPDAPTRDSDRG